MKALLDITILMLEEIGNRLNQNFAPPSIIHCLIVLNVQVFFTGIFPLLHFAWQGFCDAVLLY